MRYNAVQNCASLLAVSDEHIASILPHQEGTMFSVYSGKSVPHCKAP
jgi:hypothetical protein